MIIDDLFEASQSCPHCGGPMFSEMLMMEKKDACYYKVKASAKVWPSAYASGRLVQCRKKGAGNYGNKSEGVMEMDKSQTPPGRDGSNDSGAGKKEYTATPTTPGAVARQGSGILNKAFIDSQRVDPRTGKKMNTKGVAEEYELAGVGVAYELGRRAYKQGMTIRDNPYSATKEARKNDEWAKGLERGKHDANDARHFRSSVREQAVAEGLAQDEAEEDSGWRAEFVNEINYNTFEVKLTNTRSKESANFIVRPVDMVSYGPTLSIETMDVHDLQTGQTESWTNDDPAPDGPIAYAISGLFYDDKQLQKKLQNIIDTHDTKGQDMMPGLEKRRSIGQEVDADAYIDSQEKTQAAMAKMKKGVAEKLGDNRPKLGSKRDAGKSIRKWRSARGLDETDQVNEKSVSQAQFRTMAAAAHNPKFAKKVGISQDVAQEFHSADKNSNYKKLPDRTNEGGDVFMANIKDTPEYKAGFATGKLPVPHPEGTQQYASYYKGVIDKASPTLNKVGEGEQQKGADYRDPPEADYGDDYQDMVARVKKLAGLGPLKTVYDPTKRVYRNMPTAVQPKK